MLKIHNVILYIFVFCVCDSPPEPPPHCPRQAFLELVVDIIDNWSILEFRILVILIYVHLKEMNDTPPSSAPFHQWPLR